MELEERLAMEIARFRCKGSIKIEFKKRRNVRAPEAILAEAQVEDQKFLASNGKFRHNDILSID
jgi:hypothetical protein